MSVVEGGTRSWSGSATRSTSNERLLRVDEEAGDTVGLKRSAHFFGNVRTAIGHRSTAPFVKVLEVIPRIKKIIVAVFVQLHGQDEDVWAPFFPIFSFSTILSTVRLEHSA